MVPGERPNVPVAYVEHLEHVEPHDIPHIQMGIIDALSVMGHEVRSVDAKTRRAGRWVSLPDLLPPELPPASRAGEVTVTSGEAPVRGIGTTAVPAGALSGKTVYVSAGHGWYWNSGLGRWAAQRGNTHGLVEDFLGTEAISHYFIPMLLNAGATVFPVKEPDMNPNMVIVDDSDAVLTGDWTTGAGAGFGGGWTSLFDGTNPFSLGGYLVATTSDTTTATATYPAVLPEPGHYGVHVSWRAATDRASDVQVKVHHAGGISEMLLDQRNHGSTWVYLGRYPFYAAGGAVEFTNLSSIADAVVSVDAVRFGGGMGIISRGNGDFPAKGPTTGRPRFESCSRYHAQFCGAPPTVYDNSASDSNDDVGARSRYSAWQHPEGEDAVYVSWHSNAPNPGTGTSTWVYGPGGPGSPYEFTGVAGSEELAQAVHTQFIDSIRDEWDPDWKDRGIRSAWFGELNPNSNPEMPAVLVETAFHDTEYDAGLLLQPRFRFTIARAYLKGIVDYFAVKDGVTPAYPPLAPTRVMLRGQENGDVHVQWEPVDGATSYRVWTSPDKLAFSLHSEVSDAELQFAAALNQPLAVRITALSAGGESFPSTTLSVVPSCTMSRALIVSGFERLDGFSVPKEDMSPWYLDSPYRFDQSRMNTFDYAVDHGAALHTAGVAFDSVESSVIDSGLMDLSGYEFVDWILGEESTVDETFSTVEQQVVSDYVESGGRLFVSGAELAWDLHFKGSPSDQAFCEDIFGLSYGSDDAGTYLLASGVSFTSQYDVDYPDVFTPLTGIPRWYYEGGGVAAVQQGNVLAAGFPLETISDTAARASMMGEVLDLVGAAFESPLGTCDEDVAEDTAPVIADCGTDCAADTWSGEPEPPPSDTWIDSISDLESGREPSNELVDAEFIGDIVRLRTPPHPSTKESCDAGTPIGHRTPRTVLIILVCTFMLLRRRRKSTVTGL